MHHREISVHRTARYALSAIPDAETAEVWFACHGYGQLASRFLEYLASVTTPGRVLVAPEGLSRFYLDGGTARVGASWMTREDREAEIRDYTGFLDAVRGEVLHGLPLAPRTTIFGFSQGTATAFRWAVQGTQPPERLILWGGGVPGDHETERTRTVLSRTKVSLVTGSRDEYTSPSVLEHDARMLRSLGLDVDVRVFDGGHAIHRETLIAVAG
jgi:predicted esterase